MTGISVAEHLNLISQQHIWSSGDRFYKLAHSAYGDSKYWWVIAWYNKTPTEAHVQIGDILYIPLPLERILSLYGT
jgi:nucleoid-associated protein YgaU